MKITSVPSTWAALMGVAVWAVLSACSADPSEPEANSDTLGSQTLNTSAPETDTEGPDPDNGGNGGPAVQLPEIPIGGSPDSSSDDEHPFNQCVDVNWIVGQAEAEIPDGVEVALTGFIFNPEVFTVSDAGCSGDNPSCVGYTFDTDNQICDLAIEPLGIPADESPTLSVAGAVTCDDAAGSTCATFLAAVEAEQDLSIDLNFPEFEETTSDETTDTETTTDDTEETTDETESETTDGETTDGLTTPDTGSES